MNSDTRRYLRCARWTGLAAALALLLVVFDAVSIPGTAHAQTPAAGPADFTKLGFPNVVGSVNYTPGTATTVSGSGQMVALAADFYKGPAKFELLSGSSSMFASAAGGRTVNLAWAFRVTDTTTNQLVGAFGSPVQWSWTDPSVNSQSVVMNVTSATPPVITVNGTAPTISGQTISHPFGGATVGWLVANPAAGTAPAAATSAPTAAAPSGAAAAAPAQATPGTPPATVAPQAPRPVPSAPNTGVGPGPVRQASAPSPAQVTVAASPQLPSTGTGGLLTSSQSPFEALPFMLLAVVLLMPAGVLALRRDR